MNGSDKAVARGPGQQSPHLPRILLVYTPSEQSFAATLASDLRQRGIAAEYAARHDAGRAPNSGLLRFTQAGEPPDWLIVILSPAALWSPFIAEEMRLASALLRQQRIHGVLAIVAAPCSHGSIPPDWPVALSVDATHDYPGAIDLLVAALDAATTGASIPATTPRADITHEETTRLPSAIDVAREETARLPSVADLANAASVSPITDVSHEETTHLPSIADLAGEETVRTPTVADLSEQETAYAPAIADPAREDTIRFPSFGRASSPSTLSTHLARHEPPVAPVAAAPSGPFGPFGPIALSADVPYPSSARPAARPRAAPHKPLISRRALLGAGAVIAASALAGGGTYIWRSQQKPPPPPGPPVRWRYRISGTVTTVAVEANGSVYFGTDNGNFYALDATSHTLRWMYPTGVVIAQVPPVVVGGAVYICANDGSVYALADDPAISDNAERLRWRFQRPGVQMLTPALDGDVLYVAGKYRRLSALDSQTGAIRWQANETFNPTSPPTVAGDRIYIAAANSVYALNTSGVEVWRNPAVGAVYSQMVVENGLVYISAQVGAAFALDAATGAQRWKFATNNKVYIMPVLDTNRSTVYIGDMGGYLYALDAATGAQRWRQQLDSPILVPQVVNGSIYAVSTSGYLYALDPVAGAVRWQYVVGEGAVSPLGAGAQTLYVDSADHYFYALAAP